MCGFLTNVIMLQPPPKYTKRFHMDLFLNCKCIHPHYPLTYMNSVSVQKTFSVLSIMILSSRITVTLLPISYMNCVRPSSLPPNRCPLSSLVVIIITIPGRSSMRGSGPIISSPDRLILIYNWPLLRGSWPRGNSKCQVQ